MPAEFPGVETCHCLWTCPECLERITSARRAELAAALLAAEPPVVVTLSKSVDDDGGNHLPPIVLSVSHKLSAKLVKLLGGSSAPILVQLGVHQNDWQCSPESVSSRVCGIHCGIAERFPGHRYVLRLWGTLSVAEGGAA